jgi:hypothetical protein
MGITASLAAPSVIAGSTITGDQPKVTRMEVPGIKGADGDITWQGEWSSATTYTQNEAVQYNGSAYVALQGNSNLIPSSNASSWSVMTSKGDAGATGATGSAGTVTVGTTTTGSTGAVGDDATIQIGSITTLPANANATVANAGSDTAAVLNFGLPMGQTGAQGTFRWKGAYNASYTYGTNDVAYYNGSSYVAIVGSLNNVPTNTSYWEKMAAAGAEGGSIGSMSDTNIAVSPSDASIIMYNNSNSKWEDNQVFGTNRAALQLDGGTF